MSNIIKYTRENLIDQKIKKHYLLFEQIADKLDYSDSLKELAKTFFKILHKERLFMGVKQLNVVASVFYLISIIGGYRQKRIINQAKVSELFDVSLSWRKTYLNLYKHELFWSKMTPIVKEWYIEND